MNGNGAGSGWTIIESFKGDVVLVEPNGKVEQGLVSVNRAIATVRVRGGRASVVHLHGPESVEKRRGIRHDCHPKTDA